MELKAKDVYRCDVLRPLGPDTLYSLMSLYQPLVGCAGVSLYLTLLSEAKHQRSFESHQRLCLIMNMDITVLEQARRKLEEMMLIRCYLKQQEGKNSYIYVIYPPLEADRFFKHEVLGRLYAGIMGTKQCQLSMNKLAHIELAKEGFDEITEQFKSSVIEHWDEENEEQFSNIKPKYNFEVSDHPSIHFDYEKFLSKTSNLVFPIEARTTDNLRLIGELATMYGLGADEMRILVGRSTNNSTNQLDREKLRSMAFLQRQKAGQVRKSEDPYDLSPMAFLQSRQNGIPVADSDKRIIEKLMLDMKMDPKVVNVLLEMILKTSNNRLVPSYVESVAASWVRSGINTVEKAKKEASKTSLSRSQSRGRKDVLPEYLQDRKQESGSESSSQYNDFDRQEFEEIRRKLKEREG